ncbi:MAG: zinc ribbon domain-containing protein [Dehalococcoidia bacterium]
MPIYEYFCQPCDGIFEAIRTMRESSEPSPCPECNGESQRIMPTSFMAFTMRDGYPRRIPDKGTFWHRGVEVKDRPRGVRANEHQELLKPRERRKLSKGDRVERKEQKMSERQQLRKVRRELSPRERRAMKGKARGF